MIDKLIDQGLYKDALELLGDTSDEDTRYKRLVCLYGLGEYQQARKEGIIAKDKASKTYYDVVAIYVSILKELQEYQEAIDLLVEELNMPYIPYNYETMYNHAYDELLIEKREANGDLEAKNQSLSEEDIENILSKNDINEELLLMAIDQLQTMNIRRMIPVIHTFLKDNNKDYVVKSILIELLMDQEIDQDFIVVKNGIEYDVNPSFASPILNEEAVQCILRYLSDNLEDENPSLYEMCEQFLHYYLYQIYPLYLDDSTYNIIAAAIHYYLATIQYIDIDPKDIEIGYNCDIDDVLEIIEDFKQIEETQI